MSDLNVLQQVCVQVLAANLVEKMLQKAMNSATKFMIDDWLGKYGWKITWGPRVWKSPKSVAGLDNSWMISMAPGVAYPDGAKYNTYVVALCRDCYLLGDRLGSARLWGQPRYFLRRFHQDVQTRAHSRITEDSKEPQ